MKPAFRRLLQQTTRSRRNNNNNNIIAARSKAMPDSSFYTISPLGATLLRFEVDGKNLVLGYPTVELDEKCNESYWGQTIGRVANRIPGGKLHLNNQSYTATVNENGLNSLHGGKIGWGRRLFSGPEEVDRYGKAAQLFKYTSAHMEEGYPGTVEVRVWYTPEAEKTTKEGEEGKKSLQIEYEVELVGDEVEETVVSVTNHSYWNITDTPTIANTTITLATTLHQPVDEKTQVPTGAIIPFPSDDGSISPQKPFTLGSKQPFIDHCFVFSDDPSTVPLDTRAQPLREMVALSHAGTGIHLKAESTDPAFQVYTGDGIKTDEVDGYAARGARAGLAIEPSRYVDAAGREEWRGQVLLKKGQVWGSTMKFTAWKE